MIQLLLINFDINIDFKFLLYSIYKIYKSHKIQRILYTLNVSSGIFSSVTKEIKAQLNINDTKFCSFGTENSAGRLINSIIFGIINQKISRKLTTIIFDSLHAFLLFFSKSQITSIY